MATHGFFLEDIGENTQKAAGDENKIENPLLRSGLALAGANRRDLKGNDGILTALKASGLNLWEQNQLFYPSATPDSAKSETVKEFTACVVFLLLPGRNLS
jgi:hypothetical protein